MIEYLKYCIKEIFIVRSLLEITNSSFFKRNLTRIIPIRTDDFIKFAFSINKATFNSRSVKDQIKELQELYRNHLKIQRDKLGAHFQDLDFSTRLDLWGQLNIDTLNLFFPKYITIYNEFHSLDHYVELELLSPGISNETQKKIITLNEELDLEKYPTIGTDILSLTRYNTGGIIPCSTSQSKLGKLKSLEFLLHYNFTLFKAKIEFCV